MVVVWTSSSVVMETGWSPSWLQSGSWVSIVSNYSTYCLEPQKGYSWSWSSRTSGTPALSLWTSRIQSSPFDCRQVFGLGVHAIGGRIRVYCSAVEKHEGECSRRWHHRRLLVSDQLINNVDSIKKWPTSWVYCSVNSWSGHKAESFAATEDRRSSASTCTGKISWQPQVFLTNLKAIQFLRNNHLSVALVPRLVARLNERQELRRRRRSRSCPRCFRLKRHQHLRCQRLQKAPTERQSVFLTVMMMFRCFPFRKCCMLLLLRSNITNLEAFGGYYQKMVSDISDGDPATCDESHTDFEWFWCHKNRSSAGSSSHGHVIENDTIHFAPLCCHWC